MLVPRDGGALIITITISIGSSTVVMDPLSFIAGPTAGAQSLTT